MMKKSLVIFAILSLILITTISCKEKPSEDDEVVARIGGELITESDLEEQLELLPPQIRSSYETPEGRVRMLDIFIKQKMLEMAARERGYDQRPEVRKKMELAALNILTKEFYRHFIDEGLWIPEDELKEYYQLHKSDYMKPERRVLSHIQKGGLSDIEDIYDRLEAGEDFTELVVNESQAFGAKESKGFLKEIEKGNLNYTGIIGDKNTLDLLFSIEEGEYTKPIKHMKGYSIIRVDRVIPPQQMTFDEAYSLVAKDYLLTEDVLKDYYLENKDKFHQDEMVKTQYTFFSTLSEANEAYSKLIAGDMDMDEAVNQSAIGENFKDNGGFVNWLTRGSIIQGIGKDEEADEIIFSMDVGDYSEPYSAEKGYYIFHILERKEEGVKPFEEVKDNIASQLLLEEKKLASDRAYEELMKDYDVINYLKLGDYADMEPSEIMEKAQASVDPSTSLEAYRAFLKLYPDHPKAHKAKFLIGFIQSEDLKDYESAKNTLEEFVKEYPDSEFYDDAEWILENIENEDYEGEVVPLLNEEE